MNKRFILGIDRAKMRLYDVEQVVKKMLLTQAKMNQSLIIQRRNRLEKSYEKFWTSKYRKNKIKYYVDVTWRNKEAVYVVVELPTKDVVKTFKFKEDVKIWQNN